MQDRQAHTLNPQTVTATDLCRGIGRFLFSLGFSVLDEFKLGNGRRADLAGLDHKGKIAIVEIKTSLADFRADHKWPDYLEYCDLFYFGVSADFPRVVLEEPASLPERSGIIVGDRFNAGIVRHAREATIHGSRRRAEILRFGRKAATRLQKQIYGKTVTDGY